MSSPSSSAYSIQTGERHSRGVELEWQGHLAPRWRLEIAFFHPPSPLLLGGIRYLIPPKSPQLRHHRGLIDQSHLLGGIS